MIGKRARLNFEFFLAAAALLGTASPAVLSQEPREWKNSLGMEFVWIPPGEFEMGSTSTSANADERPVRKVRIGSGFYMGKFEVTQGQWQAVMGRNPSTHGPCGVDCPVENVSWYTVQAFLERLNQRDRYELYGLPTEAQWEYAARAGTTEACYAEELEAIARCGEFGPLGRPLGYLSPWAYHDDGHDSVTVGTRAATAFGLHDMLGSVWEWVHDWAASYPTTDPSGPTSGMYRVFRGGSHHTLAGSCRSASRYYDDPSHSYGDLGFRLVVDKAFSSRKQFRRQWAGEGVEISTLSGFFVDSSQRTRVFITMDPGENRVRLRHQFGQAAIAIYFPEDSGGASICSDPVSGLDHIWLRFDTGGQAGARSTSVWAVNPETGIPKLEYEDDVGLRAADDDGICLWRKWQKDNSTWESAMNDLNKGRDFWREAASLQRFGESIQLLPGRVSTQSMQEWLPLLESIEDVTIEHADYTDRDGRASWEVIKVTRYRYSRRHHRGILLLHDKRMRNWWAIDAFSLGYSAKSDGALDSMRIQGDRLLATMDCGTHYSNRSWSHCSFRADVEVNLRTHVLTFLGEHLPN